MLYSFAITPELFDIKTWEKYVTEIYQLNLCNYQKAGFKNFDELLSQIYGKELLNILKNISENGLIIYSDDSNWLLPVLNYIKKLPQDLKIDFFEAMKRIDIRNRFIKIPENKKCIFTNDAKGWLDASLVAKKLHDLYAIITSRFAINETNQDRRNQYFIEFSDYRHNMLWESIEGKNSYIVKKTKEDYEKHLNRILKYAKHVKLIDPYLNAGKDKWKDTIDIVARNIGYGYQNNDNIMNIEIHTKYEDDIKIPRSYYEMKYNEYLGNWELYLKNLRKIYPHRYKLFIWNNIPKSIKQFHDRFIITEQCIIGIAYGLDCFNGNKAANTTWYLINFSQKADYENLFIKEKKKIRPYDENNFPIII